MRDVDPSKDFELVTAFDTEITERVASAYERLHGLTERIYPAAFQVCWDVLLRPVLISLDVARLLRLWLRKAQRLRLPADADVSRAARGWLVSKTILTCGNSGGFS